ncbi:hypothetical protein HI850_012855 [bacterium SPL81]|nr:hypothetical protein [Acinetobacter baumannii]
MDKRILLPFTLSALTLVLNGCGGESAKINEDPSRGSGITSSTSCDIKSEDCLQFVMDYPISGLRFDCSSDRVNHFATQLSDNVVTGACKLGDTVSFYIQGSKSGRKINIGNVKLDSIAKAKVGTPPRIRLIDIAMGATGKAPASLTMNDDTIKVAMALVNIFQTLGLEQDANVIGDIQPVEITDEKRDQLIEITKDVEISDLISGQYINILKPWLNLDQVSNNTAFELLMQLINLSNAGIWTAELPLLKFGGEDGKNITTNKLPDGFFGCNRDDYTKCTIVPENLSHAMGNFSLISDRQGFILGYGLQYRGAAIVENGKVVPPFTLSTRVKPIKMQLDAQKDWFNVVDQSINKENKLRFNFDNNPSNDLLITQGKFFNGINIAGTEGYYKFINKLKDTDVIDQSFLGLWEQRINNQLYKGRFDVQRRNPSSYLLNDVFKTEINVASKQSYIFPLYATLTFKFEDPSLKAVDIGIVIDEQGDIRTDIKSNATDVDKSGVCATVKSVNADGTITDSNDQIQYRIGTTGATSFSTDDKSITTRMILSNPIFGTVDGAMFGLNVSVGTGAKINIHNLLAGQTTGINLTNFSNETVYWTNEYARSLYSYIFTYDKLTTDKNKYVAPTAAEREIAKRYIGTVDISVADQNIPACKAIKTKS